MHFDRLKRREFVALRAAAWPDVARAQQPTMPVIGFLHNASPEARREFERHFTEDWPKPIILTAGTWSE
jgi:hypothetical protein